MKKVIAIILLAALCAAVMCACSPEVVSAMKEATARSEARAANDSTIADDAAEIEAALEDKLGELFSGKTEEEAAETPLAEAEATAAPAVEAKASEAPSAEAEATAEPTAEAKASEAPSAEVKATAKPTAEAKASEAPSAEAKATATPTAEAKASEAPSAEAKATAEASKAPSATVKPTETPKQTETAVETMAYAADEQGKEKMTMQITVTNTITAEPDMATITLGVTTRGNSASDAQQENNTIVEEVIAAVKKAGVAQKDIKNSNYYIYEDYETAGDYIVEASYDVTIKAIDKVGDVIDAAVKAGANTSYYLRFSLSDSDSVYMEALQNAVAGAGKKAEVMASAAGMKIKQLESMTEESGYGYDYSMERSGVADNAAAAEAAGMTVSPGTLEVSATVNAVYIVE